MVKNNQGNRNQKDVMMYDQKIILKLNSQQKDFLLHRIYGIILRSLRDKPRTIDEIANFLEQANITKSKKSLYRYVNTLVKSGLVVLAGKRITIHEDSRISTLNLYTRSAKFYFNYNIDINPNDEDYELVKQEFINSVTLFLETSYDVELNIVKFNQILTRIFDNKEKALLSLMKDLPSKKMEVLKSIEWPDLSRNLDVATLLKIMIDNPDVLDKLRSVVKSQSTQTRTNL